MNFIEEKIEKDITQKDDRVHTRFPPEPNGYLHIGHAKSICLNFETAEKYSGKCNLRFDDTNPTKEKHNYVEGIKEDIKWLGFDWQKREYYASDYFQKFYKLAIELIKQGLAFVDDSSFEEIAQMRGIPQKAGIESPYRKRSIETNLDLFQAMYLGHFQEGEKVLRAKIDMTSTNMHLRDPILYRIKKQKHFRLHKNWYIYPMYDFAHCLSDSIEKITHSLCTLEFEVHRPLYDWIIKSLNLYHPQQIEFARLNLTYTVLSKRKLALLVEKNYVSSWDDPRLPTLSGLRRRGYTSEAIRNFAHAIGIAKRDNVIEIDLLEFYLREHLNKVAQRRLVVLNPLKVIIENYPEGQTEKVQGINRPGDPEDLGRQLPFSRELYIEKDDFLEEAPRKYFRLRPDGYVRLKYAYIIKCVGVEKNEQGDIIFLRCHYYPESRSGQDKSGIKVKGTIHWVSKMHAKDINIILYDRLFNDSEVGKKANFLDFINPNSKKISQAKAEPSLQDASKNTPYQFERLGYFCWDTKETCFNRTVTLKSSWKG